LDDQGWDDVASSAHVSTDFHRNAGFGSDELLGAQLVSLDRANAWVLRVPVNFRVLDLVEQVASRLSHAW
jgi:hypothetical protein